MKNICIGIILLLIPQFVFADNWEISNVYEQKEIPNGTKAIDGYGRITDIQYVLIPYKIENGDYKITVSEVTSGILKIEGTDLILEMKGNNYYGPCTLLHPKAEVILKIGWPTSKIIYKGVFGDD